MRLRFTRNKNVEITKKKGIYRNEGGSEEKGERKTGLKERKKKR